MSYVSKKGQSCRNCTLSPVVDKAFIPRSEEVLLHGRTGGGEGHMCMGVWPPMNFKVF